ncbi:MAG: transposase [Candidatus Promineifilaceae bacterium]
MPKARRDLVQFVEGGYYHLYNRGARRLSIFQDKRDYVFALKLMKEYCRKFSLAMIAYCLMPNHYHFLVRQDGEPRAGLLPQRVFNRYSTVFNKKYSHSGTLFERRFKAEQIVDVDHLKHLCRYIHGNPVKDGFVEAVNEWAYSNYPEWAGIRPGTLVDRQFVDDCFGGFVAYEEYLQEYLDELD